MGSKTDGKKENEAEGGGSRKLRSVGASAGKIGKYSSSIGLNEASNRRL